MREQKRTQTVPDVLYRKVGRRYEPYAIESLPYPYRPGFYLVHVEENCATIQHRVTPDYIQARAAMKIADDAMREKLVELTTGRPIWETTEADTAIYDAAWRAYYAVLGDKASCLTLEHMSASDVAREVIELAVAALSKHENENQAVKEQP